MGDLYDDLYGDFGGDPSHPSSFSALDGGDDTYDLARDSAGAGDARDEDIYGASTGQGAGAGSTGNGSSTAESKTNHYQQNQHHQEQTFEHFKVEEEDGQLLESHDNKIQSFEEYKIQPAGDDDIEAGKIFIGGLSWETTEASLRKHFSAWGDVKDVIVMRDPTTGRSRGFGFLSFSDSNSVDEALKVVHVVDGKTVDPKKAVPRPALEMNNKIFVGGVHHEVTEEEFGQYFGQFGTVTEATLMFDRDTGRARGFGFIAFEDPLNVDRVLQRQGYLEFRGKPVEIKRAVPKHKAPPAQVRGPGQTAISTVPAAATNPLLSMAMAGGIRPNMATAAWNPAMMMNMWRMMNPMMAAQWTQQAMGMPSAAAAQWAAMRGGMGMGMGMNGMGMMGMNAMGQQGGQASGGDEGGAEENEAKVAIEGQDAQHVEVKAEPGYMADGEKSEAPSGERSFKENDVQASSNNGAPTSRRSEEVPNRGGSSQDREQGFQGGPNRYPQGGGGYMDMQPGYVDSRASHVGPMRRGGFGPPSYGPYRGGRGGYGGPGFGGYGGPYGPPRGGYGGGYGGYRGGPGGPGGPGGGFPGYGGGGFREGPGYGRDGPADRDGEFGPQGGDGRGDRSGRFAPYGR